MHGDARVAGLLAQRDLGQQRHALTIGDEFHDGRERGCGKGAGRVPRIQSAGRNGLIAEAMAFIQ